VPNEHILFQIATLLLKKQSWYFTKFVKHAEMYFIEQKQLRLLVYLKDYIHNHPPSDFYSNTSNTSMLMKIPRYTSIGNWHIDVEMLLCK